MGAAEKTTAAPSEGAMTVIQAALVSLGVFFCYISLLSTLAVTWWTNPVYSHGFLIPFISAYLIRRKAGSLKGTPVSGGLWGAPLLATGLAAFIIGRAAGVLALEELSLMLTMLGAVAFVFGWPVLKAVLFPLLYLAFMLTSWGELTEGLHYPFQNFSAGVGAKLLQVMHIPAYRESIYIELPNITLEVAKVCSGVNYLVSVAAIGVPLAYVALRGWWRRVALVAGALIMSVLANAARVTLIGFLAYHNLAGDLHGPLHVLHAMVVSFAGYIVLFAGVWILSRGEGGRKAEDGAQDKHGAFPAARNAPLIITLVLLVVAGLFVSFRSNPPVPLKEDLRMLPLMVNGLAAAGADMPDQMRKESGADQGLTRRYRGAGGDITLNIGYFESQSQGRELVNFRSSAFHNGAAPIRIKLSTGEEAAVNKKTIEAGGRRTTTLFWYMINGRVVAGRYDVLFHTAFNFLMGRGTGGAFVTISAEDLDGAEPKEALEGFAGAMIPELTRFIP